MCCKLMQMLQEVRKNRSHRRERGPQLQCCRRRGRDPVAMEELGQGIQRNPAQKLVPGSRGWGLGQILSQLVLFSQIGNKVVSWGNGEGVEGKNSRLEEFEAAGRAEGLPGPRRIVSSHIQLPRGRCGADS